MNSQDENIQFTDMPDWGGMFPAQPQQQTVEDKVYHSLYEELVEKCNPALFAGTDNFLKANQLYVEIRDPNNRNNEQTLISLRNRAIEALGIRFSTKKKFDYLKKYFDVAQYTQMEPYDAQRVAKANEYYTRLQQDQGDIMALDQLESDAKEFIERRKEEITGEKETPSQPDGSDSIGLTVTFLSLIVLLIFILLKINEII